MSNEVDTAFQDLDAKLKKFKEAFAAEFIERVKRRTPVISGKLQAAWAAETKGSEIDISNSQPYAKYVEYGTAHMAPKGMLRTTVLESEQIAEVAKNKVGLK